MWKGWPSAHLLLVLSKGEVNLIWLGGKKWGGYSMEAGGGGRGFKVEKHKASAGNNQKTSLTGTKDLQPGRQVGWKHR